VEINECVDAGIDKKMTTATMGERMIVGRERWWYEVSE
jgi:hypothetical protein